MNQRLTAVFFVASFSILSLAWADYTVVPTEPLTLTPGYNTNRLGFGLRTEAIVDDTEFFHVPTWPGRTELGMFVNPFFDYHYNDSASVELGGLFEQAYGGNTATDNSNEVENGQPWIRI